MSDNRSLGASRQRSDTWFHPLADCAAVKCSDPGKLSDLMSKVSHVGLRNVLVALLLKHTLE